MGFKNLAIKEAPWMVWCKDHSTLINTTIQLVGYGTAMILTAKGATEMERARQNEEVGETIKDKVTTYGKYYWKPMLIYTATGVYTVHVNRKAAFINATLSTALMNMQSQYANYRQAVKDNVKTSKQEEIQQTADKKDISNMSFSEQVYDTGKGTELFLDKWTGQLYLSSMYNEKNAFLEASSHLLNSTFGTVNLNFLNDARGLMWSSGGEFLGWDTYDGDYHQIEYDITPCLTTEVPGMPPAIVSKYDVVRVVSYVPRPIDDARNWSM